MSTTITRPLPGPGDLLQRTLPRGALAVKRPPVLADVRSPVLAAQIDARLPTAGPILLRNPGAAYEAQLHVAPLAQTTTHAAETRGRHVDTWA